MKTHEKYLIEDHTNYRNLGYANEWEGKNIPDIIKKCKEKKHVVQYRDISKDVTEKWCDKCKYYYKVDSSD